MSREIGNLTSRTLLCSRHDRGHKCAPPISISLRMGGE